MDRKKAIKKIERYQRMAARFVKKATTAGERWIDTSCDKVRVLEYGFDSQEKKPLFVDIHGGGWALMFPELDEGINHCLLEKTKVKIISIDYPKAPQNPFPIGIEATYEVIKHYYDNAEEYGIDRDNIGIGGYSSGGNFATVACIMANERKDIRFKYQILCYPGTDAAEDPYNKPKCKKGLTNKMIEAIVLSYFTDPEDAKSPYASPVYATNEQLTGLPPVLMISAGDGDPLTPEGHRYRKKLEDAGVRVELHEFKGVLHGFMQEESLAAEEAIGLMIDFINSQQGH
ncbi:MAG: alpha/beta hydrolase [Methanomassiliicoccaceae archaeon]|nr:alpha/beta hydrolase [Methanomassiliicoccaceae archaeon]